MTPGAALAQVGAIALLVLAGAARADDVVAVDGRLSDEDFYRLVSCAAPPGGDCATAPRRWRAERPIRVALRQVDPAYLGRRKFRAEAALTRAVQELNGSGAGFRLSRVGPNDLAEIAVYFLDLAAGATVEGTGIDWVDGSEVGDMVMRFRVAPGSDIIDGAALVVSTSLETPRYEAAVLKQLTRAMGLTTEVEAAAYRDVSVLARGGEGPTRLGPQDVAALRSHYAKD